MDITVFRLRARLFLCPVSVPLRRQGHPALNEYRSRVFPRDYAVAIHVHHRADPRTLGCKDNVDGVRQRQPRTFSKVVYQSYHFTIPPFGKKFICDGRIERDFERSRILHLPINPRGKVFSAQHIFDVQFISEDSKIVVGQNRTRNHSWPSG